MADYEKALSRYEQLNQKFFSNSELLSDRDAVKEVERINRKVENLYELEEKDFYNVILCLFIRS